MVQKLVIDKRATTYHLKKHFTNLETYSSMVNSDIETFNQHVKVNVEGLK